METHRCEELLEYNKKNAWKPCAIQHRSWLMHEPAAWILSSLAHDDEMSTEFMKDTAKIRFCPFCGTKLATQVGEKENE